MEFSFLVLLITIRDLVEIITKSAKSLRPYLLENILIDFKGCPTMPLTFDTITCPNYNVYRNIHIQNIDIAKSMTDINICSMPFDRYRFLSIRQSCPFDHVHNDLEAF